MPAADGAAVGPDGDGAEAETLRVGFLQRFGKRFGSHDPGRKAAAVGQGRGRKATGGGGSSAAAAAAAATAAAASPQATKLRKEFAGVKAETAVIRQAEDSHADELAVIASYAKGGS